VALLRIQIRGKLLALHGILAQTSIRVCRNAQAINIEYSRMSYPVPSGAATMEVRVISAGEAGHYSRGQTNPWFYVGCYPRRQNRQAVAWVSKIGPLRSVPRRVCTRGLARRNKEGETRWERSISKQGVSWAWLSRVLQSRPC